MAKFQFFSTRQELHARIDLARKAFGLNWYAPDFDEALRAGLDATGYGRQIYLSGAAMTAATVAQVFAGGGVQVDLGREDGGTIGLSQLAITAGTPRKLFNKLRAALSEGMIFSICGRNVLTGAEERYEDIGITKGALDLHRAGARLVQRGVDNVVFLAVDDAR